MRGVFLSFLFLFLFTSNLNQVHAQDPLRPTGQYFEGLPIYVDDGGSMYVPERPLTPEENAALELERLCEQLEDDFEARVDATLEQIAENVCFK